MRHNCAKRGWQICSACRGRVHLSGCTTAPNPAKDCCSKRHKQLHDAGEVYGLDDSALKMLPYEVKQ